MPPKKTISPFIPAKTIPKRDGNTTVGPRPSQATRLLALGGFDKEKLEQMDVDREKRGLATLKEDPEEAKFKKALAKGAKEAKAAREQKRREAMGRAKAFLPPDDVQAELDEELAREIEEERREWDAAVRGKGPRFGTTTTDVFDIVREGPRRHPAYKMPCRTTVTGPVLDAAMSDASLPEVPVPNASKPLTTTAVIDAAMNDAPLPLVAVPNTSKPVTMTPVLDAAMNDAPLPVVAVPNASKLLTTKPLPATPLPSATPPARLPSATPLPPAPLPSVCHPPAPLSPAPPPEAPRPATPLPAVPVPAATTPLSAAPLSTTPVPATPGPAAILPVTPLPATPLPSQPVPSTPVSAAPKASKVEKKEATSARKDRKKQKETKVAVAPVTPPAANDLSHLPPLPDSPPPSPSPAVHRPAVSRLVTFPPTPPPSSPFSSALSRPVTFPPTPPPSLPFSRAKPSSPSPPATHHGLTTTQDDNEDADMMDVAYPAPPHRDDDGDGTVEKMAVSCPAFLLKPAFSIYEELPWSRRRPEWELDELMTEDPSTDTFDMERYMIETYHANVDPIARCKFEHPGANDQTSSNPFAPLQNANNSSKSRTTAADFYLTAEAIQGDLGPERPQWILSAYGPGKETPEQLWGGQLEQSPEEMRLHAMTSEAAGNLQGALRDFDMLKAEAMSKIETAWQKPDAAINYVMQALYQHPNRLDMVTNNMNGEFAVGKRPVGFASAAAPAFGGNPFGQPSAPVQSSNPFSSGTPGFGQPSAAGPAPSAFGQPAQLGAATGTGFGQASALGAKPNPFSALAGQGMGFGQPSQPPQSSAFGQPSQPVQSSAFGQPSQPVQSSAFGQPSQPVQSSAFGQPSQPSRPNAFGQPSQPSQASPFGQPSQLGAKPNPFGAASGQTNASPFSAFANTNASGPAALSPFAQNAPQQSLGNAFSQPPSNEVSMGATPTKSTFSNTGPAAPTANPFGQPAQPAANPFGQPAQTTAPAFGQPSQPASNPFGRPAQPASNPFGQPAQQSALKPFGAAASLTSALASSSSQGPQRQPDYNSYATKDPATGQVTSWKGRAVARREMDGNPTVCLPKPDGTFSKIWFPDGPPAFYKDTEPVREYEQAEKDVWAAFAATGKFQLAAAGGGGMPLAPPMRALTRWDF